MRELRKNAQTLAHRKAPPIRHDFEKELWAPCDRVNAFGKILVLLYGYETKPQIF